MANPIQQGLKRLKVKGVPCAINRAAMANPIQQGLKPAPGIHPAIWNTAAMANPIQQGLKHLHPAQKRAMVYGRNG